MQPTLAVLLALTTLLSLAATTTSSSSDDSSNFILEHAFHAGEDAWTRRGSVAISYSRLGRSSGTVKFEEAGLSGEERAAFNRLLEEDGFYRLRLVPADGDDEAVAVGASPPTAFVRACALRGAGFREYLLFHADIYGNVVALDYRTSDPKCSKASAFKAVPSSGKLVFKSKGKVSFGRQGDRPNKNPQFLSGEQAKKKQGPQEKTFFQKYWMYIVGFVAILFLQLAAAPPEGGSGGGGGGR